jgi:membrane-bound lytic murein transglycosylase B
LNRLFSDSRVSLYPTIVEKKGKGLDYFNRRFGLLTKKSIARGQKVLRQNRAMLEKVEAAFGVDKEVILGILRVETNFGSSTGAYPIFNSLLTMSLIENRRSSWAEEELIELLRICKEQHKDPLSIKGSWAGAFGVCQFIPTSYARFAVDGNGDGSIDLFDFHDAVASIANYLRQHGFEHHNLSKGREAVYAYNHCDNYVKAVLAYAKATRKKSATS